MAPVSGRRQYTSHLTLPGSFAAVEDRFRPPVNLELQAQGVCSRRYRSTIPLTNGAPSATAASAVQPRRVGRSRMPARAADRRGLPGGGRRVRAFARSPAHLPSPSTALGRRTGVAWPAIVTHRRAFFRREHAGAAGTVAKVQVRLQSGSGTVMSAWRPSTHLLGLHIGHRCAPAATQAAGAMGGDGRNRTGGEGFADPCLATWLRRPRLRL